MPSNVNILKSSNGVILRRIPSPSSAWPDYFQLQTKRTPQEWNFENVDAALKAFYKELTRC
jgi:hypothetical protein